MQLDAAWLSMGVAAGAMVFGRIYQVGADRRARRQRAKRAAAGEARAEALLERQGLTVLERQAELGYAMLVDGEPTPVRLRADYAVLENGRWGLAEVKTGTRPTNPRFEGTRRQLLEYAAASGRSDVLLVDADRGQVRRISFPILNKSARFPRFAAGLVLGAALTALFPWVQGWFLEAFSL